MIQRLQTIYLLVGALALVSMASIGGLWEGAAAGQFDWFVPVAMIVGGATVLTAIWAIFLYTNRKRQRKVVLGVQILTLVFIAVLVGAMYFSEDLALLTGAEMIGLAMPVAAYVLFYLARRRIEADIKLVKSMDRLRE